MAGPLKTHFARLGGQQWIDSFYRYGAPVGNVFFVSSGASTSSSTGPGYSPETAFTTINAAIAAATPDNGDVILVEPAHVETVTAAAGLTALVAQAGISIIGMGYGRQRPKVLFTTAIGASCDIVAPRTYIENLSFVTGFDAQTAMINVSAADVTIKGCEVEFTTSAFKSVLGVLTTAAADRFRFEGNHCHGSATAGTAAFLRLVGGDAVVIKDNRIIGNFTTTLGGVDNATTAATNLLVEGNTITNRTASASVAINAQAGTTGQIVNNRMSVLTGTAPIVAAGINCVGGNYYAAAAGVSAGTLL